MADGPMRKNVIDPFFDVRRYEDGVMLLLASDAKVDGAAVRQMTDDEASALAAALLVTVEQEPVQAEPD